MRRRIYDKIAPMVLSFLTFSLAFYQLLKIYHMESLFSQNLVIIALFCLVAGLLSKWFIKLPLYFFT
ncbi:hypothetical protein TEHD86_1135 [Tetragenococcus halophilus subsp. halophilus]|uniref:hypothetical protein n=1 Tax=Tetragenococcus halophilus TaxID=51669 RepID=UPI000CB8B973|nr:hypothetical protein [Tetragenococcus halophilus]GBD79509.1 hypothetical protein TEHD10_0572 [Tetragenococcus halophilus subsp. halophilus]GBD82413.1 hypothetical protein TEHD86_1135 [Tetragenococcus halophilus subsp. halophilus]GFK20717.1 hypothetical protein WJ7_01800 [Tetragenococcus halophilus]